MFLKQCLVLLLLFLTFSFTTNVSADPKTAKALGCGLQLLIQAEDLTILDSDGIRQWALKARLGAAPIDAHMEAIRDRAMKLQSEAVQSVHLSGKKQIAKFLMDWADFVDKQAVESSDASQTKPILSNFMRVFVSGVLIGNIYWTELVDADFFERYSLALPLSVLAISFVATDEKNKTRMQYINNSIILMAAIVAPIFLIPDFAIKHDEFINNLFIYSAVTSLGSWCHAMMNLPTKLKAKPQISVSHPPPVASPAREWQTLVQGSRTRKVHHVVIDIRNLMPQSQLKWLKTSYLDLFL